jgi:ComF family protein
MSLRPIFTQAYHRAATAGASLMELCYPSVCRACDRPAPPGESWCLACERELAALQFAPACDVCAMPLAEHLAPCPYCEGTGLRPFARIARLGIFASPLKELIHRVKYAHDWPLGERLAERLAAHDAVQEVLSSAEVIVPVPLFWRRHVSRGFNQADLLAAALAKRSAAKVRRAVVRLRDTPTQTALHKRAQRLENLKNAFGAAKPEQLRGKHVVLVDDVITTAATLQTMAREVRRHDPASISVVILAIADPKGRAFETI